MHACIPHTHIHVPSCRPIKIQLTLSRFIFGALFWLRGDRKKRRGLPYTSGFVAVSDAADHIASSPRKRPLCARGCNKTMTQKNMANRHICRRHSLYDVIYTLGVCEACIRVAKRVFVRVCDLNRIV